MYLNYDAVNKHHPSTHVGITSNQFYYYFDISIFITIQDLSML